MKSDNLYHLLLSILQPLPRPPEGLLQLKALRTVYLYQAPVDRAAWQELKAAFPAAILDSGGYVLPASTRDTILVSSEIR